MLIQWFLVGMPPTERQYIKYHWLLCLGIGDERLQCSGWGEHFIVIVIFGDAFCNWRFVTNLMHFILCTY